MKKYIKKNLNFILIRDNINIKYINKRQSSSYILLELI